jgi:hypothetical protein
LTIARFIVGEGNWLPLAMTVAAVVTAVAIRGTRTSRARALLAMNVFFGCVIGVMTIGHLLAVTVKFSEGTLKSSPWFLYALGIGLTLPAWWLVLHSKKYVGDEARLGRVLVLLNAGLGGGLVAVGLVNIPLAIPAALNVAYQLHRGQTIGRAIVGFAIVVNVLLFVGGLVFMASGQTFEEFSR